MIISIVFFICTFDEVVVVYIIDVILVDEFNGANQHTEELECIRVLLEFFFGVLVQLGNGHFGSDERTHDVV